MEREVHSILGPLGVKESLSRLVAEDLRGVEEDTWGRRTTASEGVEAMQTMTPRKEKKRWRWGRAKGEAEEGGVPAGRENMGLTAFLLKFGEGLGEISLCRD